MKKITIFLLSLMIAFNLNSVSASTIDFNRKGSIEITLKESTNNESVVGASIKLVKIADAKVDNNSNLSYEFVDELSNCNVSLSDLTKPNIKDDIERCLSGVNVNGIINSTDSNGKVSFSRLDLGLYLVSEEGETLGYSNINSFLINIPTIEDNDWIYDLESEPKTEIIKVTDLTVNKVWKNNNMKISEYVTVQLLKGTEVIDTVQLNSENNWTYTFRRMPLSDEYSILEVDIPDGYKATYKTEGYTFTVINTNKLPQTGELSYLVPIFVIAGMLFMALGIYIDKKNINE